MWIFIFIIVTISTLIITGFILEYFQFFTVRYEFTETYSRIVRNNLSIFSFSFWFDISSFFISLSVTTFLEGSTSHWRGAFWAALDVLESKKISRKEWRRWKTTLEKSEEDEKLHSKRVRKMYLPLLLPDSVCVYLAFRQYFPSVVILKNYTRNGWRTQMEASLEWAAEGMLKA